MDGFQYHVDGLDVDLPWNIVQGTTYRPAVSVRAVQTEIPGRSGVFVSSTPHTYDVPTLTLVFALSRQVGVTLQQASDDLVGAFARPGEVTITRFSEGQTTYAQARLVSMTDAANLFIGAVAAFTVTLRLPSVFFRGEKAISAPFSLAVDTTVEIPTLSGGTAPVTDAVLRVRGPLGRVAAVDPPTRTGISWTGALAADEYLYLDAAQLTARRTTSATAWEAGGQPVSGAVDYPAAGPLQMWPTRIPGDPLTRRVQLQLSAAQGRTDASALTVRAARAHL